MKLINMQGERLRAGNSIPGDKNKHGFGE